MEIHWDIFITHTIGFLITLFILWKYAWGPLLGLLEERRNKIKDEFQKIDDDRAGVDKLTAEYESKLRDIESERRAKLTEAINEGKKVAEEIKSKAQSDAKAEAEKPLKRCFGGAELRIKGRRLQLVLKGKVLGEWTQKDLIALAAKLS